MCDYLLKLTVSHERLNTKTFPVKPYANGHHIVIVGRYMLHPLAHPVAGCWEFLRKV